MGAVFRILIILTLILPSPTLACAKLYSAINGSSGPNPLPPARQLLKMEPHDQFYLLHHYLKEIYLTREASDDKSPTFRAAVKYLISDPSLNVAQRVKLWEAIGEALTSFMKWGQHKTISIDAATTGFYVFKGHKGEMLLIMADGKIYRTSFQQQFPEPSQNLSEYSNEYLDYYFGAGGEVPTRWTPHLEPAYATQLFPPKPKPPKPHGSSDGPLPSR